MTEPPLPPPDSGDPPDLDRVVDALRNTWAEVPDADRSAIWQAIEGHLGPQDDPGRDPRPGFLRGVLGGFGSLFHGNPVRQVALAGAAALLVGALAFGVTLRGGGGTSASAAVLERVNTLSTTADAALNDNSLTPEELLALRDEAHSLLAQIEGDDTALRDLTPEQLAQVISTLQLLATRLDEHEHEDEEDDDLLETVASIRASSEYADDVRREHEGEDDDEGEHASSPTPAPTSVGAPAVATGTATASPTSDATAAATPEHEGDDDHEEGEDPTATPAGTATATGTPSSLPQDTAESIPAAPGSYTRTIGSAGSVTFAYGGGELEVTDVSPAGGWSVTVPEAEGSEIRVRFTSGGVRATFEVERQDNQLEITVDWSAGSS